MFQRKWLVIGGWLLTVSAGRIGLADDKAAHAALKGRGLIRVGSTYILAGERALSLGLRSLEPLQRELSEAARYQAMYDEQVAQGERQVMAAVEERRRLTAVLARDVALPQKVQIAARIAELTDRIELLRSGTQDSPLGRQIRGRLAKAKEEYTRALLKLREGVNNTLAEYEALARDKQVQTDLAKVGEVRGRQASLGPRRIFLRNVEKLEDLESAIFTATIQLRAKGSVFWVDAIINEEFTQSMILDTGASLVCVPRKTAGEMGLRFEEDDPLVRMRIASGEMVEGRLVTLDSVRVGKFMVRDVECVVLGPEASEAEPLLGNSFLRGFKYEINPDTGMMTLTKVEVPDGG
jgi:aspartyl protease family protein